MRLKILNSIICLFLLVSCSHKFSIQKRKYTKGFYLAQSVKKFSKNFDTKNDNRKGGSAIVKSISNSTILNNVQADVMPAPEGSDQIIAQSNPESLVPEMLTSNTNSHVKANAVIKHHQIISKVVKSKREPKENKWDTLLFILVGFFAGLFLVISLAALTLYASTMAGFYLLVLGISAVLSIVLFLVMRKMSDL